ncbi:hypothetical protein LMG28727_07132 [Paraburkholderia kirstenboschensis]|nr:hypothetical protein LMG28727_07132 [Paraburkholderia kirstenboschensis]
MKTRWFAMLAGGALLTSMTASAFAGVVVGVGVPAPVAVVPAVPVYAPPTVVVQNGYAAAVPPAVAPVVTVVPAPRPPMAVVVMPRRPVIVVRGPRRVWMPGHWVGGVWVAGHWL